ncbi:SDR family oxidoreductase [Paludibacterium purpuratum]|uniref:3-oxoacyl-[acyl-carrier protein] reductase n=1 Tax=Paludibacterium purpuratum TaxID=1144873 RepID=A0A4R7BCS0_9NEIS|nr:SDR family oxidoreductase [Paludibacterium purpuratum]TDR82748.1 3-oxoacyl-[acyl-carrier protein] reductase [Paludibacterium purpuratum]
MSDFKNARILVLGASTGIGYECAKHFCHQGAQVCIASSNGEKIHAACESIGAMHGNFPSVFQVDLSDSQSVDRFIEALNESHHLDFDRVVLNAGGPPYYADSLDIPESIWLKHFQSLFLSQIKIVQALVPKMKERRFGRFVLIGSSGMTAPIPGLCISNAIRSAMHAWLKSVSDELSPFNININTVIPGKIATARLEQIEAATADRLGISKEQYREKVQTSIPSKKYGRAEDIVNAVAFLMNKEASSYITGSAIRVDGGLIRSLQG